MFSIFSESCALLTSLIVVAVLFCSALVTQQNVCDKAEIIWTGCLILFEIWYVLCVGVCSCKFFLWKLVTVAAHLPVVLGIWLGSIWATVALSSTAGTCEWLSWLLIMLHSGVAAAISLILLQTGAALLLGPPTFDRRPRWERKIPLQLDFILHEDFGDSDVSREIATAGGRLALCHCPGRLNPLEDDL
ncbi:hypothetical protein CYMTET_45655, partial [Cymbomonas tetramitiformis]